MLMLLILAVSKFSMVGKILLLGNEKGDRR